MIRRAVCLAVAMLISSPAVVWAEDEDAAPDFGRPGWYLGLGATFSQLATGTEIRSFTGSVTNLPLTGIAVQDGRGVNARVGFRFFEHLAVELDADFLPDIVTQADYNQNTVICTGGKAEGPPNPCSLLSNAGRAVFAENQRQTSLLVMTGNAKLPLLTGRFQPFLLAGVGFYRDSSTNSGAKVTTGVRNMTDGSIVDVPNPSQTEYFPVTNANIEELNLSNTGYGFAARLGGGLDLFFTEEFALTTDVAWMYLDSMRGLPIDDPSFLFARVGLLYRFK